MTLPARYLCPVCWCDVKPTIRANIASHFDSIRNDICPAGGEPFRITIDKLPEFTNVPHLQEVSAC